MIKGISLTDDSEILASASDRHVRIYKKLNNTYTLDQTIDLGFYVYGLKITYSDFMAYGNDNRIFFYKNNGS